MINSAKPDLFDQRRFMLTRFARLLAILARGAYDMKVAVHLEEDGARLLQFDGKNPTEAGGMIDDCFVEFDGTVIATVEYKDLGLKPHWYGQSFLCCERIHSTATCLARPCSLPR